MGEYKWIKGYDDRIQENNIKYLKQEVEVHAVVEAGNEFTPDLTSGRYFEYTLTADTTMLPPVRCIKGQTGTIVIQQDAVGDRTVDFEQFSYEFGYIGNPTIGLAANTTNLFKYTVIEAGVNPSVFMEFVASYIKEGA